jgi:uncharacterized phage protein (predicted DNA packaging)
MATTPTLTEVKAYLRIDHDTEDALIEALLSAAIEWAEEYTGLAIGSEDIPQKAQVAIMMRCADLYENRQSEITGTTVSKYAQTAEALLSYYRFGSTWTQDVGFPDADIPAENE